MNGTKSSQFTRTRIEPIELPKGEADRDRIYSEWWTAQELLRESGPDIRHSDGHGWLVWDGTRWERDKLSAVEAAYQRMVDGVCRRLPSAPDQKALASYLGRLLKHYWLRATLGWLKVAVGVRLLDTELENKPYLWNFKNGTFDLKTGELREHRREDLLLNRCDIVYDEHATCPMFWKFLDETFAGDEELKAYIQRVFGIAMLGKVLDHALYIVWGLGANGKTTLVNIILAAFGEYGMQASPKMLLKKRYESHPTDLAQLYGARLVVCSESGKGEKLDEERVKMLTGGDRMCARFMRQDNFEFEPSHSLVLCTNNKPEIGDQSLAMWRRLKLVSFGHTVPKEKQDPNLVEKMKSELPGIVAWLVRGCMDALKNTMQEPKSVEKDTQEYQTSEDIIAEFIKECCCKGPRETINKGTLYDELERFTGRSCPISKTAFGKDMKRRGYRETQCRDVDGKYRRAWLGIGLRGKDNLERMVKQARRRVRPRD